MEDILEKYERQNHTELTGDATNETQVKYFDILQRETIYL